MLKVDIIYGSYLSNRTGPSTNLLRLLKHKEEFRSKGLEINVFSLDTLGTSSVAGKASLKTRLLTFAKKAYRTMASSWKLNHLSYFANLSVHLSYIRYAQAIVKYYQSLNRKADVLVFDEYLTCLHYLKENPDDLAKKVLFHHGNGEFFKMWEIYYPGIKKSVKFHTIKEELTFVLESLSSLVFVSDYGRNNFLLLNPQYNKYQHKFERLYYGVEEKKVNLDNRTSGYNLVCVGSVNARKSQHLIVEAFLMLHETERAKFKIDFLGNGDVYLDNLKEKVKKNYAEQYLCFRGGVDNVEQYLSNANAFILTSLDEGLPISMIEAMQFELPIIGTKVAGIPEAISNKNGIVIENTTVENVHTVLKRIQQENLEEMGKLSKELFLKEFVYTKYISNYTNLMNSLVKENN